MHTWFKPNTNLRNPCPSELTLARLVVIIGSAAKNFVDRVMARIVAHAPLTTIPLVAVLGIALVVDGGLVFRALRLAFLGGIALLSHGDELQFRDVALRKRVTRGILNLELRLSRFRSRGSAKAARFLTLTPSPVVGIAVSCPVGTIYIDLIILAILFAISGYAGVDIKARGGRRRLGSAKAARFLTLTHRPFVVSAVSSLAILIFLIILAVFEAISGYAGVDIKARGGRRRGRRRGERLHTQN